MFFIQSIAAVEFGAWQLCVVGFVLGAPVNTLQDLLIWIWWESGLIIFAYDGFSSQISYSTVYIAKFV